MYRSPQLTQSSGLMTRPCFDKQRFTNLRLRGLTADIPTQNAHCRGPNTASLASAPGNHPWTGEGLVLSKKLVNLEPTLECSGVLLSRDEPSLLPRGKSRTKPRHCRSITQQRAVPEHPHLPPQSCCGCRGDPVLSHPKQETLLLTRRIGLFVLQSRSKLAYP